jgi:hypothetical protein
MGAMAMKRRSGSNGNSSSKVHARTKKHAPRKLYFKRTGAARTRTSLVGATIYQPDLKPSPVGQKLLEALES